MRRCESCGTALEGRTPRARFCDARCRVRFSRGHRVPAVVVELPVDQAPSDSDRPVELITLEELVVELQTTIRSRHTPPSAKAGLSRELRAALAEIEKMKPAAKDGFDELLAARKKKQRA